MNNKNLLPKIGLFELAHIKSCLVVEVNVQTRPNNDLINTAVLGVVSASIGVVMSNLLSSSGTSQRVLLDFKRFNKLFNEIIVPSISDKGNVRIDLNKNECSMVYGSCNNITRVFPKLAEIGGVEYANIEIITNFKYKDRVFKLNSGLKVITGELIHAE